METRLDLTDTGMSAAIKLAEGNPGAISVIVGILKDGEWIDPVGMGGLGTMLMLDTFHIYGSRIWMLYKDVCGQDIIKTMAVIRACQLGIIRQHDLNSAIDGNGKLDTDDLLNQVKERLGTFGERNEKSVV